MKDPAWFWAQAGALGNVSLAVPGWEALALLVVITLCLLFRLSRTGLVVTYLFAYRWGFLFGQQHLAASAGPYHLFVAGYLVFGVLVLTLAAVAMLSESRS